MYWLNEMKNGRATGVSSGYSTLEKALARQKTLRWAVIHDPAYNHGAWVGYDWEISKGHTSEDESESNE